MKKRFAVLGALGAMMICSAQAHAGFVAAVDLDPGAGNFPGSLHPNFSFGGDTTTASQSTPSAAIGLPLHDSIFGGDGSAFPDTYVMSYTPGVDADNFFPAAGSLLGSTTGFGTEVSSGLLGGGSGLYNVYITVPDSTNVNALGSIATITGDGAPVVTGPLNLNSGGTGADLDAGPGFVGGANNAWLLVGTVALTAGNTYTLTLEAEANTFVSQRLAGVMWEAVPEPATVTLLAFGTIALIRRRR